MLGYLDANLLLSEVIDQLQEELSKYAAKPDAKSSFIDKQNKLIANLTAAYNGFQIPDAHLLQILGYKMKEMRSQDPYIKGFTVSLIEKSNGYMGKIDLTLIEL